MAKFVPKILEPILNYVPNGTVEEVVSYGSKAMRAKIIADRYTRGFEVVDRKGSREAYDVGPKGGEPRETELILTPRDQPGGYLFEAPRLSRVPEVIKDYISIVDIDYNPSEHNDSRYYSYLSLPFVPHEINYIPESKFVGIASFGSSNPIYHYTGSEDTLTFVIDWFSKENHREDVIFNCRWMEALTKADGNQEPPHRVKIIWGGQNTQLNLGLLYNPQTLFGDSIWILVDAPYKLSQFNRGYMDPLSKDFISTNMLPQQALQTVTFKRITSYNRSSKDIIGSLGTQRNQ